MDFTAKKARALTACHHALQPDDVGVVKLSHDAGLPQEVLPLPLHVAPLQRFDGHRDLLLPRGAQATAAYLPKFTCITHTHISILQTLPLPHSAAKSTLHMHCTGTRRFWVILGLKKRKLF